MKKIISVLIIFSTALTPSLAQIAVQRTTGSSYLEFQKYLSKSGNQSFVQSYIQISSTTEVETPLIEKCLEEMYVGLLAENSCFSAVKSLTAKPLNQARREILFSFLAKIEKNKPTQKQFYRDLRKGLLRTHPELARIFQTEDPVESMSPERLQGLEMKAWKKAVVQKFPLDEIALLINGIKIEKIEKWTAPAGVYQWTLVTNTHEPFFRLGTFSQFAAESLKNLNPLAPGNCEHLQQLEEKSFGLLRLEVFANPKCISRFGHSTLIAKSDHLGRSSSMVKMESSSNRHWVWPIVAIAGVGLVSSLRNKQVTIQMPSFQ